MLGCLNWLLKQRKGAEPSTPRVATTCSELPVPSGKAGRLSGKGGNVLRSIEKETSTFCFLTDHRAAADGESRDELMPSSARIKRDRYKAMDLMEDAMEGTSPRAAAAVTGVDAAAAVTGVDAAAAAATEGPTRATTSPSGSAPGAISAVSRTTSAAAGAAGVGPTGTRRRGGTGAGDPTAGAVGATATATATGAGPTATGAAGDRGGGGERAGRAEEAGARPGEDPPVRQAVKAHRACRNRPFINAC